MINSDEVEYRRFQFSRADGSIIAEQITLLPGGKIDGYRNSNEHSWAIDEGKLVFRSSTGVATTIFDGCEADGLLYRLTGSFLQKGPEPWHVLTRLPKSESSLGEGILPALLRELYSDDGPFGYVDPEKADGGYPHTNLKRDLVESVLSVIKPTFWLELGSMLGGSAIRAADTVKAMKMQTEIICIDPFTGDVNMWAWERGKKSTGAWQFLRLEQGRPTIYDRFLANVAVAGHDDIILPISATSIVGLKLLRRLHYEKRISALPQAIYLDSAHEPDETLLELRNCWNSLEPGGVLMGDDWGWASVRNDVTKFAAEIDVNRESLAKLMEKHGKFTETNGILLDEGQWVLAK